MDLWNFCKVWILKYYFKVLLLICFYWGGGKNEVYVCVVIFYGFVFLCVVGVRGRMGDIWVIVYNFGEERSFWYGFFRL